jgi:hypothetical protein
MPTLCILTAHDSRYEEIAAISAPFMRRLADAHGYTYTALRRDDCVRGAGWIKIEPILDVLSSGKFDFLLWLDADAMPVRTDVDVLTVARSDADLHMAWHRPLAQTTNDPAHYNTGVMLIRASDWSRRFFEAVWQVGPLPHRWNDQAAIHRVLGYDGLLGLGEDRDDEQNRRHVGRIGDAWNSIPGVCFADDPIILHYAGIPDLDHRAKLMRDGSAGIGMDWSARNPGTASNAS